MDGVGEKREREREGKRMRERERKKIERGREMEEAVESVECGFINLRFQQH